jgi:cytochrome o ubiquinol oxidase operon protein cyoD
MNTENYFEDIGMWPRGSKNLFGAYATGFALSLLLTLTTYIVAVHRALPQGPVLVTIILLACAQFAVQVVCFLHLGIGRTSRDRLIALGFAVVVVLILVSGSLWIMFTLNGRMMPDTAQMEQYMQNQEGI